MEFVGKRVRVQLKSGDALVGTLRDVIGSGHFKGEIVMAFDGIGLQTPGNQFRTMLLSPADHVASIVEVAQDHAVEFYPAADAART